AIRDVVEQEGAALQRRVDQAYMPFDPDRETLVFGDVEQSQSTANRDQLLAALEYLLDKANFEKLSDVQIEQAVRRAESVNLRVRVNLREVKWLHVWVRGRGHVERQRWIWRRPIKGDAVSLPVYRRMAVAIQLDSSPHVIVKVFKDIPEAEIEALLPNAQVRMSWFDRMKLFFGGAGAVGATAFKLLKIAITLAALSKLMWILLVGAATLALRTLFGYRSVCRDRDLQRTRHLYFQNLGNNGSALQLLITLVKREELKEALLAYCFCLPQADRTPEELRSEIEQYLYAEFQTGVDFDVADALETLERLGVWHDRDRLLAAPPATATAQLLDHWAERRSSDYHAENDVSRRLRDGQMAS
ncbi:MAG: DUF3754 domain-containing protein, partial [Planctomycetota bacterium]